jgi:hypothetical protein
MFDSFGLDKNDVESAKFSWTNIPKWFVGRAAFVAWWVLQHVKGYKHLDTKIYNNESISGKINTVHP